MSETLDKQSKAKKIKILLKNYKRRFGRDYQEMANFKEPIAFLVRETGKIEFFDNCTKGYLYYTHTDGTDRQIKLSPEYIKTFDYGKRQFKGYLLDENAPTPIPEKPVVTSQQFQQAIDKTQNDINEHKAKTLRATSGLVKTIAWAIAGIILALTVASMFGFTPWGGGETQIVERVVTEAANSSGKVVSIHP